MGKKHIVTYFLAIFLGFSVFLFVRPTFADLLESEIELGQYLASGESVDVGIESFDGFSHAFYVFNGQKTYISNGNQNDLQVNTKGEYIVFSKDINGEGQIFLYHIPTKKSFQITYSGTNIKPVVNNSGIIVWEGWIDEGWQLFIYDGTKTFQLTQGDISVNPDINEGYVVFARKFASGIWNSIAYSLTEDKFIDISSGEDSEYPKLEKDGTIYFGPPLAEQKKSELKVQDLFLLDLDPLTSNSEILKSTITPEEVLEELKEREVDLNQ